MDLEIAQSPASWAIAAINVAWFLFVQSHGDTTQADTLIRFGALDRASIWKRGESWRLLSSVFLHVGWIHLLWNTWMMFGWCKDIEQELGTVQFGLAYLMTGIGASAVSVMGHRAVSAGASGAGFGMIGVALMIAYRHLGTWDAFFASSYVQSILRMIGIWFLLGLFVIRHMDNYAHAGGLLFGLMAGYALNIDPENPKNLRIPVMIVVVVVWIGVVLMSLNPRFARRRDEGMDQIP